MRLLIVASGDITFTYILPSGPTLRKKHLNAIVERNKHIEAHRVFTATLDPALVSEWEKIADDWDRDFQYPKRALNPFEVVGDGTWVL